MQVRYGVVAVVFILPPLHAKTLHQIANNDPRIVTVLPLLENLVVEEVVREPPTLLPEKAQEESAQKMKTLAA